MKLLHTADWHLGKRLGEYLRLEEQRAVLNEICTLAEQHRVDAVLIAGDLFDTFNPSTEATELFYRTVHRLSQNGSRAVIAIAGNHDSPDRIAAPDPLARECGIILYGKATSELPTFQTEQGVRLLRSAPGFIELALPETAIPLRLLLTPYANEATLRQYLGEENREEALRTLLRDQWQQLANQYLDDQGVNVLMAHLYFMQKDGPAPEEPDDEKPILHLGGAQAIFTEDIPAAVQYAALGHLHRYQTLEQHPCPVVYSSSPLAYSFSEAHQQKYAVLVEAELGQPVNVTPLPLQSGRKLVRKRFQALDEAVRWLSDNPNTYVELTLVSDTYLEGKTKKTLYDAHDGIVYIIPEIRQQSAGEEQAASIDLSQDIRQLFSDYFQKKKGQAPHNSIMDLFNEVLSEEGGSL